MLYGKTPHGKRMIRCGCNDDYVRDDPETECFDDMEVCPGCGKYPWYLIDAATGGSNRAREKRRSDGREF